jgi:hypothetical protein
VQYWPNGDITLDIGAWTSAASVRFINTFSPFFARIQYGRLWIKSANGITVPLFDKMKFKFVPHESGDPYEGKYVAEDTIIHRKVADVAAGRAAFATIAPYVNWVKTFLKMSDGWVMHETVKSVVESHYDSNGNGQLMWHKQNPKNVIDLYRMMVDGDEADYLWLLCNSAAHSGVGVMGASNSRYGSLKVIATRFAEKGSLHTFYDKRFDFAVVKKDLYNMVKIVCDTTKIESFDSASPHAPSCPLTNVIQRRDK